ncbi:DUF4142 domain-containing protein [Brasilonema sp. UFV-L1]|uniref:DUF4142 domain-containing protein n=1 Tax=Brasilonema sp. UFV-L1 TaxID=2234130 RepID=UPI00145F2644|nr:DUF4142 domain-containing protein [Brasilonema sp. UFV-L1]NMG06408.1 DUF4142 domain-containing protein [Brasilonema sp. UFV-L1]
MLSQKKLLYIGVACISSISSVLIGSCFNSPTQFILAQTNSACGNTKIAPETTNSGSSLSAPDKEFMTKVARSNRIGIATSDLALQKSVNQTVTHFAKQMKRDYEDWKKQLEKIARNKRFNLPKDFGPDNESFLKTLKSLDDDKKFNRAYMRVQVQIHSNIQSEFQNYCQQGQDQALKGFAEKILPVVEKNRQDAGRKGKQF